MTVTASGLEGVVVANTELSAVDGERGRLVIRGYDAERLAAAKTFEEVCGLLWSGQDGDAEAAELARDLGLARQEAFDRLPKLGDALDFEDGMDALRAGLSHTRTSRPAALTAAAPVLAAAWWRRRHGLEPIAPDSEAGQAADYLRMVTGAAPAAARVSALDTYLVTVSDHGMNASTFTVRVIASTASDMVSAVVGAVGALKGPLHGGAPGPVLDMLDAIGRPDNVEAWLDAELTAGRRLMGFGHRVYRVRDPRAAVFERALERLDAAGFSSKRLSLAREVERAAVGALQERHPDRPLHTNVEFYTALLLDTIGLPRELFAPTFAVGRIAGWCAHFAEQREHGRLIRPDSRYVGPTPDALPMGV